MKDRAFLLLLSFCLFVGQATFSYEDLTHQALTKRALIIAGQNAPDLPVTFQPDQEYGAQVIAGAGMGPGVHGGDPRPTDGEDYTDYRLNMECPVTVTTNRYDSEPLSHFADGILWGHPANKMFQKFYGDAVTLWKAGKKAEAAFILGRALHLIEDMAQPQHAMDEWHLNRAWGC